MNPSAPNLETAASGLIGSGSSFPRSMDWGIALRPNSMRSNLAMRPSPYLATPFLAVRLVECTKLVLAVPEKSAHDIFGSPDDMKFRSSMTLFEAVGGGNLYRQAIDRFMAASPTPPLSPS